MRDRWRVAVIDSGLADGALADGAVTDRELADNPLAGSPLARGAQADGAGAGRATTLIRRPRMTVVGARRFVDNGYSVSYGETVSDPIGHGTAVTRLICSSSSSGVELMIAQVLNEHGVTTPASVAAALCWAIEARADLIHISLGLREDRRVLADAVAGAVGAGCVVIASTPARGSATFPAAYGGVIRATGDARCAEGEISVLDTAQATAQAARQARGQARGQATAQAHFGGCPQSPGHPKSGGASIGAAAVSGVVVACLVPGSDTALVCAQLTAMARYRGAEKKLGHGQPIRGPILN